MTGIKRQVTDKSYYLSSLKQRNEMLINEIAKFKNEIDQIHKEKINNEQVNIKLNELIEEITKNEGQLADYNLAIDKYRA